MRKMITNTDCGSDDAVTLMMAPKSRDISVEAITAIGGNVPLDLTVKNALMTIEVTGGQKPPLFVGAARPLFRELVTAVDVHGKDGMGNAGLIRPTLLPENGHAVDVIIRIVRSYPNEIKPVAIGPTINVVLATMKDSDTMKRVKQIYTMGTSDFGPGDCILFSEFGIYADAEAFYTTITAGISVTIISFDLCLGKSALTRTKSDTLMNSGKKETMSAVTCNRMMVDYNITVNGQHFLDPLDAIVVGVILWDGIMLEKKPCYAYVCLKEEATYGQVILNDDSKLAVPEGFGGHNPNVEVCTKTDTDLFEKRLLPLLM